jgi:hypothetical protein
MKALKIVGLIFFVGLIILGMTGCSKPPRGFYVSQNSKTTCCLEFKNGGKVIIRDLHSMFVDVQTYTVEKNVVRINQFRLGGVSSVIEFSIDGNRLISANGLQFKKDTSGKSYTPMERIAELNKVRSETDKIQSQILLTNKWLEIKKEERRLSEIRFQQESQRLTWEQVKRFADAKRVADEKEAARLKAIADKEYAKRVAAAYLPVFTNQIVTIMCNDGITYSNISLAGSTLDGITYRIPEKTEGGCISYLRITPEILEELHINTNLVDVARDRLTQKTNSPQVIVVPVQRLQERRANNAESRAAEAFRKQYGLDRYGKRVK